MQKLGMYILCRSTVKCRVCGGWGGEWGLGLGIGAMCADCYKKGGHL